MAACPLHSISLSGSSFQPPLPDLGAWMQSGKKDHQNKIREKK
jgi:hypothetical protein